MKEEKITGLEFLLDLPVKETPESKEIERLNNIINELKEWLKENVKDKKDLYFQVVRKIDILDKIEELENDIK